MRVIQKQDRNRFLFIESVERRLLFAVQLATSSDHFVDSIGINVAGVSQSAAIPLLNNLGIRYVRSGNLGANPSLKGIVSCYYATSATNQKLVVSAANVTTALDSIKANNAQSQVIAVEGPDEYDINHGTDTNWVASARAWDQLVHQQMRADSWFNGIPYIGTSMGDVWNYASLGDESAFTDAANAHPYAGVAPEDAAAANWIRTARADNQGDSSAGSAVWATESGYSTGTNAGQEDETIQARYIPTMLLDQYNEGFQKSFIYDLADKVNTGTYDGSLGLYEYGAATIKPAGSAVKNLISILQDPQSTPFSAGGLNYSLGTLSADVRTTLLEKADGAFYLAYWRELTDTDAISSAENVTLTVSTPVSASASLYTPNISPTPTAVTLSGGATTLAVTDQLQMIALTPTGTAPTVPAAPGNVVITAVAGSRRDTVSWTDNSTNEDGFVIDRLNPDGQWITLGTAAANATSFADSSILPGDTYSYRVTAVNRSGGATSAVASFTAPAGNFTDDNLNDFTDTTAGASTPSGWQLVTGGNGAQDYDPSVAQPTSTAAQSLTYRYNGAGDFLATAYLKNTLPTSDITVATSPDGVTFTNVALSDTVTPSVPGYTYNATFVRPVAALPTGTNYVRITFTNSTQMYLGEMRLYSTGIAATTPTISSTQIGNGGVQRSSINSFSVTFSEAVNLTNQAYTLYQEPLNVNGSINTSGVATIVNTGVTMSTSGNTVTFTVLPGGALDRTASSTGVGLMSNGIYQLVLHGSQITDAVTGTQLFNHGADLNVAFPSAEAAAGSSSYFHVLFGDSNGDGTVNLLDYRSFVGAYLTGTGNPAYDIAFDANGDGTVNLIDYRQFVADYLKQFVY